MGLTKCRWKKQRAGPKASATATQPPRASALPRGEAHGHRARDAAEAQEQLHERRQPRARQAAAGHDDAILLLPLWRGAPPKQLQGQAEAEVHANVWADEEPEAHAHGAGHERGSARSSAAKNVATSVQPQGAEARGQHHGLAARGQGPDALRGRDRRKRAVNRAEDPVNEHVGVVVRQRERLEEQLEDRRRDDAPGGRADQLRQHHGAGAGPEEVRRLEVLHQGRGRAAAADRDHAHSQRRYQRTSVVPHAQGEHHELAEGA
mmetsp:Transcript_57371/g.174727  ORF Transcript_57371/g.174727 Transcript_57371/m.174727 type:complete len:263 (-) Transcript_57371:541-1329(-)